MARLGFGPLFWEKSQKEMVDFCYQDAICKSLYRMSAMSYWLI
ncbi:hypothetical protein PG1511B_0525 [Bifidobacterium pseudolongum subsp. globosum]|nr:hypothetical protein PG1511B_0525 [Bifidobacterium pseudolongum subsp. globosum]